MSLGRYVYVSFKCLCVCMIGCASMCGWRSTCVLEGEREREREGGRDINMYVNNRPPCPPLFQKQNTEKMSLYQSLTLSLSVSLSLAAVVNKTIISKRTHKTNHAPTMRCLPLSGHRSDIANSVGGCRFPDKACGFRFSMDARN